MDFETADRISSTFGLYAGILAFLIPVALWWCGIGGVFRSTRTGNVSGL